MKRRTLLQAATVAPAAVLASGCATLPEPVARAHEAAFDAPETTKLGRLVAAHAPGPGLSGLRLLLSGHEAYGSLIALADHAERSLDLQYYLIRSDASSRALMRRVRAAADRGVHVRLLLDDLNTAGQDAALLRLTQHPRIDVRLYNPFPAGRVSTYGRVMASLADLPRINRRMHNKLSVADGALAITGGRNIGDPYFTHSPSANFLDADLLVAGPVVRALSASFDAFWNSPAAYPIESVMAMPSAQPPAAEAEADTQPPPAARRPSVQPAMPPARLADELAQARLALEWAPVHVLADHPLKSATYTADLVGLLREARERVTLITPYFVPGPRGVAAAQALAERGVKLRVLTNSLATTDASVVHIGYARYREALLRLGVELHELRPRLGAPRQVASAFGSSHASLHAKVLVIDGQTALVGSMNMDPRSSRLNTELGLATRSPVIARQLDELFDEITHGSTWRVSLGEGEALRWTTTGPEATTLDQEPEAGFWLQMTLRLLSPLAPDEML